MKFAYSTYIITYLVLFIIGASFGYVLELLFRRFVSAKRWVNPGFLKGPWLPLYGFGIVLLFTFTLIFSALLPETVAIYNPFGNLFGRTTQSGATPWDLIIIGSMWVALVALEFLAGIIFVKGFKVKLWDYSNMRGNILGVICPAFNIIWLVVVLIYYYGVSPFIYNIVEGAYTYMFGTTDGTKMAHFGLIFIIGIIYGVFIIDLVTQLKIFPSIVKFAKESGIAQSYENARAEMKKRSDLAKAKLVELIPEKVKASLEKAKERKSKESKFRKWLRKVMLINPNITDASANYDENGRPISTEEK